MSALLGAALIPYYGQLMDLLETNAELKKSSRGILRQVLWSAGCVIIGGVLLGPIGAMIGGIIGSIIGYVKSDNYTPMVKVLKDLNDEDKKKLAEKVQTLVGSGSVEALTSFVGTKVQREMLLNLVRGFTENPKEKGKAL